MKRYLLFTLLFLFTQQQFTRKLYDVLNIIQEMYINNSTIYKDHLGEKCLNKEFDDGYAQFIYGIKKKSSNEMSLAVITMFTEIITNCNTTNLAFVGKETFNKIKGIDLWFLVDFIPKLLEDYLNIYFDYYHNPYSNHTDLAKLIAKILIELPKKK
jgi:hypothetical protein